MLVTLDEVLIPAQKHGYAVGAFNVYNLETAQGVIAAAVAEKSPVIMSTSQKAIDYAGLTNLAAFLLDMAERAPLPVVVHLDHGKKLDYLRNCLANGWSSIQFDSSSLPESEKIPQTQEMARLAAQHNASIEGERDMLSGNEDYVKGEAGHYTDPDTAAEFIKKTGIDAFAVSIGNAHGKPIPGETLDLKLLKKIRDRVEIPLVLHGASYTPANLIKQAIELGITKINIDTELRQTVLSELRNTLDKNPDVTDPRDILGPVRDAVVKTVQTKIRLFGSAGRAK